MRIAQAALAAALLAAPAVAQDTTNTAAAPAPVEGTETAPATEMNTTNEIVLAPGEATTAMPVAPMEPVAPAPVEDEDDGGFPWGVLGLIGLIGLLGRKRHDRVD